MTPEEKKYEKGLSEEHGYVKGTVHSLSPSLALDWIDNGYEGKKIIRVCDIFTGTYESSVYRQHYVYDIEHNVTYPDDIFMYLWKNGDDLDLVINTY